MTTDLHLTGAIRQHYVPNSYLRRFVNSKNLLYVYDRVKDEFRQQATRTTAKEIHLYTLKDDQGRDRFELENALQEIESAGNPVISNLIKGCTLSNKERSALSFYMAILACRSPGFLKDTANIFNQMDAVAADITGVKASNSFSLDRQQVITLAMDTAGKIAPIFLSASG